MFLLVLLLFKLIEFFSIYERPTFRYLIQIKNFKSCARTKSSYNDLKFSSGLKLYYFRVGSIIFGIFLEVLYRSSQLMLWVDSYHFLPNKVDNGQIRYNLIFASSLVVLFSILILFQEKWKTIKAAKADGKKSVQRPPSELFLFNQLKRNRTKSLISKLTGKVRFLTITIDHIVWKCTFNKYFRMITKGP